MPITCIWIPVAHTGDKWWLLSVFFSSLWHSDHPAIHWDKQSSVWEVCAIEMPINSLSSNLIKPHFSTQLKKKINLCNPMRDIEGIDLFQRMVESVTDCAPQHYPPGSYISAPQLHKSAAAQLMGRYTPHTARWSSSVCAPLFRPCRAHYDSVSSPSMTSVWVFMALDCTRTESGGTLRQKQHVPISFCNNMFLNKRKPHTGRIRKLKTGMSHFQVNWTQCATTHCFFNLHKPAWLHVDFFIGWGYKKE